MQASIASFARILKVALAGPRRSASHLLLSLLIALVGQVAWHAARAADDDFLEPEKAFQFSARPLDAKTVEVIFDIAPGYYLYRDQFRFTATGATLGPAAIPPGKVKFDETFQKNVETYRDTVKIAVPVENAAAQFRLVTTSQGCADKGLCYPPMQSSANVSLTGFGGVGSVMPVASTEPGASPATPLAAVAAVSTTTTAAATGPSAGESSTIESVLRGGAFWPIVGVFFVAGLLLSLTPCVLPMLPIVSSIIVGHGGYGGGGAALAGAGAVVGSPSGGPEVSRGRGFALAASYSFGMAIVYTAFGVAAGLAGEGLAATLQNPWVLGAFALGLVALSLSMFGVYELQMPQALTCRVTEAAQRLPGGRVAGVCAMGGVSALIVSPCVAAPLAGALLYLSQTRNVWLGGTALFSLAAGMSVPLLLVGASAGALLPRAGAWMVEVKMVFGVLLLGVALWTVQPVMARPLAVALWGALALVAAAIVYSRGRAVVAAPAARPVWRLALAAVLGLAGLMELAGAAAGGNDPLQPLAPFTSRGDAAIASNAPRFTSVRSSDELDAALRQTSRPVVLDFYADWCVSCKEMERDTFTDAAVQQRMNGALLLRADVTANSAQDRALLRRFHLFGPPAMIFFDRGGKELDAARLVGFQNSDKFIVTLQRAGL